MNTPGSPPPEFITTAQGRRLAYHRLPGKAPGVLFCGGFMSDMSGTKAQALESFCRHHGRANTSRASSRQLPMVPSLNWPPDWP